MRLSLRFKLFLVMLMSSLVPFGIAGWIMVNRINAGAEAEAQAETQNSSVLARTLVDRGEHSFLTAADILAMAPGTADVIAGPAPARELPWTPSGEYDVSTFFFADRRGRVVSGFEGGKPIDNQSMALPGLQEALRGQPNWSVESDAGIALLGFAPVVSHGLIIGAVGVGGALDHRFVEWVKADTGHDCSILNPTGETIATTLPSLPPISTMPGLGTPVPGASTNNPPPNRLVVGGQTLEVYTLPLQNSAGRTVGYLAIWSPLGPLERARDQLTEPLIGLGLIILGVDILIALVASNAATRQIRQLTASARRIARGDYDRPSNVHGRDEIGDLGRAFEDMRLRIGEADRLKSAFISTVSHELRTPLAHIKGYSQLLLADAADEETRRDYLHAIDQASDRMTRLVKNMLDVSQIEAGLLELFKEPVAIGPFLERQVEPQRRIHPERAFALELAAELPTVEADPQRLVQVVRALLDNAVQYSPSDAPIVVRSYVPEGPKAGPDGGGREVVVEVEDQGIGIASDDQAHVFEPFYRVECGLDRRNQGSGLELAICRGIIKAHGGRIWLCSASGQGSTFGFSLPIGPFSE